jgi:hypothetical protein
LQVIFIVFSISTNGCMDDVAASVGFAGWAFAAMCDHALFDDIIFHKIR